MRGYSFSKIDEFLFPVNSILKCVMDIHSGTFINAQFYSLTIRSVNFYNSKKKALLEMLTEMK